MLTRKLHLYGAFLAIPIFFWTGTTSLLILLEKFGVISEAQEHSLIPMHNLSFLPMPLKFLLPLTLLYMGITGLIMTVQYLSRKFAKKSSP